jgi:hypothetical protein
MRPRRAVVALAVCTAALLNAFVAPAGAQYPDDPGELTVSDATPDAGDRVTLSGEQLEPGTSVVVHLERGPALAHADVSPDGSFEVRAQLPQRLDDGSYRLIATGIDPTGAAVSQVATIDVGGTSGDRQLPLLAAGLVAVLGAALAMRRRRGTSAGSS